jgi:hypothetical protein
MSFSFKWPRFSDQFHADAIHMLNNALNKGDKPPVIADRIEVVELEMGTEVRVYMQHCNENSINETCSRLSLKYEISGTSL